MADHTKDVVANIIAEAKFGSGAIGGVAAYEKHAFANNEGDPMQAPPDSIDMHMATINRAYRKLIGRKMGAVAVFDNGILTPGRTFTQYVQDDRWINGLINGYSAGAIPLDGFSHAIHWQNGSNHGEDVFGVMPTKWVLDLEKTENEEQQPFPMQVTDTGFLNSATSGIQFSSDKGFKQTQPLVNSNFTILMDRDGTNAIDLIWRKLTVDIGIVTNKDGTIGQDEIRYPYAKDYEISIDLTFWAYNAILLQPKVVTASLLDWDFTLTMAGLGKPALKIDNLFVNTSNITSMPEFGLFNYEINLIPGDTFDHTADLTLT